MDFDVAEEFSKSRLKSLLDHLGRVDDVREPWRVAHPLREVLFLVVCGTICDCEDYDTIADWGEQHLDFLRRFLPFDHGVPGGLWLTILMNRIDPVLFSEAFSGNRFEGPTANLC
jgi:DDE_Tnp_1-associated